jgi:hypothetical protein
LNKSLSLSLEPPLQSKGILKEFVEQPERAASFSVSGSTASGLLLFSWDGGQPLSD